MDPDDVQFTQVKKLKKDNSEWKTVSSRFFIRCRNSKKVLKAVRCDNIKSRVFDTNLSLRVDKRCNKRDVSSRSFRVCNEKETAQRS